MLIDHLQQEHRTLLEIGDELGALAADSDIGSSGQRDLRKPRLREILARMLELFNVHERKEVQELFPALLRVLPEEDHWQIKMIEIQSEAIAVEATHLLARASDAAPALRDTQLQETVARLLRWLREHAMMEEERLFPKLRI
jgi:iron-sulfur cluster repair protein YtfE (RIC family)